MSEAAHQPVRARVLLAEDHLPSAELLLGLLQAKFDVIAAVHDGQALLTVAAALEPDVIVTDIGLPGVNGLEAARQILRRNPDARVVFVTVDSSFEIVQRGLEMGALGYVLKLAAGDDLVPAVHSALRGLRYVSELPRQPRSFRVESGV